MAKLPRPPFKRMSRKSKANRDAQRRAQSMKRQSRLGLSWSGLCHADRHRQKVSEPFETVVSRICFVLFCFPVPCNKILTCTALTCSSLVRERQIVPRLCCEDEEELTCDVVDFSLCSPNLLFKFIGYLQVECKLGHGGRLGYIDAICEVIDFR